MTQDEIIEIARQCGFERLGHDDCDLVCYPEEVEVFAKLVAEHERKECAEHYLGIMRNAVLDAVKREREECAKVCDGFYLSWIDIQGRYEFMGEGASKCAGAIRARGQT